MPTLDNAADLVDLFKETHSEFVVVVLQPGKKRDRAIIWYNYKTPAGKAMLGDTLKHLNQGILPASEKSDLSVEK